MCKKWSIEEIVFLHYFHKRELTHRLQAKLLNRTIPSIDSKRQELRLTWDGIINEMTYLRINRAGNYEIQKQINGKSKYFGTYNTLEDAQTERDLLIKYNWDIEKLCECHDETVNGKIIVNNRLVGVKA